MKFSKIFLLVALITISHYAAHAAEVEMSNNDNATSSDDEVFDHLTPVETEKFSAGFAPWPSL